MKSLFKNIVTSIIQVEAQAILKKYRPTIIAVTGSVGKTSTKDAIYTVLKGSMFVRKSDKSFNSEIGVPLTIIGRQNGWNNPFVWLGTIFYGLELIFFKVSYPKVLVLEVGADKPGDIRRTAEWLKPDISVITRVSDVPVHVEFFLSAEAVLKEKSFLAHYLKKNGTLVLFADDEKVRNIAAHQKGASMQKVMTFGITTPATVTGSDKSLMYHHGDLVGMSFKLNYEGNSLPVMIRGVAGSHLLYPLIAAATVGIACKIPLMDIVNRLTEHAASKGRMNILAGMNGSVLIDDTYNSSPDALHEALNTLESIEIPRGVHVDTPVESRRKIAVLGDMMELGKYSIEEHQKAGVHAGQVADIVISVGQRARLMPNVSMSFDTSTQAADYLQTIVQKGDIVLVKGSQSIRMEKIVKALLADSSKAKELLVRQEPEWLNK